MTARRVHAVLAAGVQSPHLIDRWQADAGMLQAHGIEPASIDLAALWKFSGFTTKVRHNGVRNLLPMSFRLMGAAGFEIDFFAAYASFNAVNGRTYSGPLDERCRKLVDFMQQWLDMSVKDHVLLWDVIRHELALVTLAEDEVSAPPDASATAGVARIAGRLILHEMQSDPNATVSVLAAKNPALEHLGLSARYCGYWRPEHSADVHVVELDAFGYSALANVDGVRSTAQLSELLGLGPQPAPDFLRAIGQFADAGIIRIAPVLDGPRT
jgi:hypothetical protein